MSSPSSLLNKATSQFFRLVEHRYGSVEIWQEPNPIRPYVIGIDAASGGAAGDYACGAVVDAETCALVAVIRERCSPIPFGRRCARLGWYYNTAMLAFETYPSGHGLMACHSALQYGYQNLYRRRNQSTASRDVTEELGWHTNVRNKDMMIGRITEAIQSGCDIPSQTLISELLAQRYEEPKEERRAGARPAIVCIGHDDLMDAYAIALLVRDEAWRRGEIVKPEPPPLDETARFWEAWDRKREARGRSTFRHSRP